MSIDSHQEQITAPDVVSDGAQPAAPAAVQTPPYVPVPPAPAYASLAEYPPAPAYPPVYAPASAPAYQPAPEVAFAQLAPRRSRPRWVVPAAIAVVGLLASGALGYLFYSTNTKLESTRQALTATQLELDGKSKALAAEQAQAAYVRMFTNDLGRTSASNSNLVACDSYSSCRTAAESALTDAQAFQSDRQSARVPASLTNVDSMLGDGLSAYIAALRNLVTALDSRNSDRIQAGFTTVNDAMLSVFKAQSALGSLVQ